MPENPKNIVLCSDGTGNSGGKAGEGTNVWRIFRAVDVHLDSLEQIAFHDDGVGTQSNKLLKIVGGATGLGLSRNIRQLYRDLVWHYDPGDNIFLFGFSRGAFTVRSLAGLIYACGVIDKTKCDAKTLRDRIDEAFGVYRQVHVKQDRSLAQDFRDAHSLVNHRRGDDFSDDPHAIPIKCVGVWDTVGAVGLPIDELTDALDLLFKWNFYKHDLLPCILNGFHALAIDDARHSFHPEIWDERTKKDYQTIEQVWFSGVHSNVGGGYPKDQMAMVTLQWMMEKAYDCGLRYREDLRKQFEDEANVNGKLYDSRSGLSAYYRFRPRNIGEFLKAKLPARGKPKIHASVFRRIQQTPESYAPANIPGNYDVVPETVNSRRLAADARPEQAGNSTGPDTACAPTWTETPEKAAQREEDLESAWDTIWMRRVLYFCILLWTGALIWKGWSLSATSTPASPQVDWFIFDPVFKFAAWLLPSAVADGISAFRNNPAWLISFAVSFWLLFKVRARVTQIGADVCTAAWKRACGKHVELPPAGPVRNMVRSIRKSSLAVDLIPKFKENVLPYIVFLALAGGLVWWLLNTASAEPPAPPDTRCGLADVAEPMDVGATKVISFKTSCPGHATDILVEAGQQYRIEVDQVANWKDKDFPAGPDGLIKDEDVEKLIMRLAVPFRRSWADRWFKLLGSVGNDGEYQFGVGKGLKTLEINATGRLYFYVNDAVCVYCLAGPWQYYDGEYKGRTQNDGTARIKVTRL